MTFPLPCEARAGGECEADTVHAQPPQLLMEEMILPWALGQRMGCRLGIPTGAVCVADAFQQAELTTWRSQRALVSELGWLSCPAAEEASLLGR